MTILPQILENFTAGNPMTLQKWIRCTLRSIRSKLAEYDIQASISTIRTCLRELGYSLRVNAKKKAGAQHPDRDKQFQYINHLKTEFLNSGRPVISIDTKKKELIGLFQNAGQSWCIEPPIVLDHDFPDPKTLKLVPFGIYDLHTNQGAVYASTSLETSAFLIDGLCWWWESIGQHIYPTATELLILCDGGGANGSRRYYWKYYLQRRFSNRFGLSVTVCHFPPGTSKWNPIEHRLFSYISINWAGKPLENVDVALNYIRGTKTATGLNVIVKYTDKQYLRLKSVGKKLLDIVDLQKHVICPCWNYTIQPQPKIAKGVT